MTREASELVQVRMTKELKRDFQRFCKENDLKMMEVMRFLIKRVIREPEILNPFQVTKENNVEMDLEPINSNLGELRELVRSIHHTLLEDPVELGSTHAQVRNLLLRGAKNELRTNEDIESYLVRRMPANEVEIRVEKVYLGVLSSLIEEEMVVYDTNRRLYKWS